MEFYTQLYSFLLCICITNAVDWNVTTPLDEYLSSDDGMFSYEYISEYDFTDVENMGCRMWILNFTSQRWMDDDFSSQSIWFHYLVVSLPPTAESFRFPDAAYMYITGGRNNRDPPSPDGVQGGEVNMTCTYAAQVGVAAALLTLIPNQPIVFPDDPDGIERREDGIIAWTWSKFIDEIYPANALLQLPMTKGAVKAMDLMDIVVNEQYPDFEVSVDRFFVSGGSKRGWIAWLCGATDKRVVAIAPIVLSCLNMKESFEKHYRSLGGWSWVLDDYYDVDFFATVDQWQDLTEIVDPYEYRERLTIPKLVISATGDEFFLPDDSYTFYQQLPEPKFMMMVENTNHGLGNAALRVYRNLMAFFATYLSNDEFPSMTWNLNAEEDGTSGSIEMNVTPPPVSVKGWRADTIHGQRRDYRMYIAGPIEQEIIWEEENVEQIDETTYTLSVEASDDNGIFRAFLINAIFDGPFGGLEFTTEVQILPEELPFDMCEGQECMEGDLV